MLLSLGGHSYEIVKTRLLHLLMATALNLLRMAGWLAEVPLARTRTSPLVALGKAAACY